jgi:hypothetical protein
MDQYATWVRENPLLSAAIQFALPGTAGGYPVAEPQEKVVGPSRRPAAIAGEDHCPEDNLIDRRWNMAGLTTAWWTLLWFWIPAHTVTFSLQTEYQIGLAAIWSLVLGPIMGYTKREHSGR